MTGEVAYRRPALVNPNVGGGIEFCPMCHQAVATLGRAVDKATGMPVGKYLCNNKACSMRHYTRTIGPGGK